ncbi:hypothetical protein TRAPUB_9756 [Trametes pubescens]|uniref:Uncharacterized protein n=1 Tax=Trametes pubescens TaxID=154538 RepID=A0A1M2W1C2_TRAPU|nr:hypothetical protein TRAPUB_9756 [Trametes pubescens]
MSSRKKQRTDSPVAVVPRRSTRQSTKAARADRIVAEDSPVVVNKKSKVKQAAQDTSKRVACKGGRLQTLPDLALDIQLEASRTGFRG